MKSTVITIQPSNSGSSSHLQKLESLAENEINPQKTKPRDGRSNSNDYPTIGTG